MVKFYSTREVAGILDVKPDTLQKAIWQRRVEAPQKVPGGAYGWTEKDIEKASWVLNRKPYQPEPRGNHAS